MQQRATSVHGMVLLRSLSLDEGQGGPTLVADDQALAAGVEEGSVTSDLPSRPSQLEDQRPEALPEPEDDTSFLPDNVVKLIQGHLISGETPGEACLRPDLPERPGGLLKATVRHCHLPRSREPARGHNELGLSPMATPGLGARAWDRYSIRRDGQPLCSQPNCAEISPLGPEAEGAGLSRRGQAALRCRGTLLVRPSCPAMLLAGLCRLRLQTTKETQTSSIESLGGSGGVSRTPLVYT